MPCTTVKLEDGAIATPWVIRKQGAFYRSNYAGYTYHIEAAGLYTKEEAEKEAATEPNCMSAHPLSDYRDELVRNRDMAQALINRINARMQEVRHD